MVPSPSVSCPLCCRLLCHAFPTMVDWTLWNLLYFWGDSWFEVWNVLENHRREQWLKLPLNWMFWCSSWRPFESLACPAGVQWRKRETLHTVGPGHKKVPGKEQHNKTLTLSHGNVFLDFLTIQHPFQRKVPTFSFLRLSPCVGHKHCLWGIIFNWDEHHVIREKGNGSHILKIHNNYLVAKDID